jgi:probable phosphoglycerate mutase
MRDRIFSVRIIFIRHGRTRSNVDHLLDTAFPGAPLDDVGEEQALCLPAKLATEPIEVVMTSDITRARQTGEPLARALGVPLMTHPGVREIQAGSWELDTDWVPYVETIRGWAADPARSIPEGDNGVGFMQRFDGAIDELSDYGCAAVVSHGAALHTWLMARTDRGPALGDMRLGNTDVVIVQREPTGWRLLSWADQSFSA